MLGGTADSITNASTIPARPPSEISDKSNRHRMFEKLMIGENALNASLKKNAPKAMIIKKFLLVLQLNRVGREIPDGEKSVSLSSYEIKSPIFDMGEWKPRRSSCLYDALAIVRQYTNQWGHFSSVFQSCRAFGDAYLIWRTERSSHFSIY